MTSPAFGPSWALSDSQYNDEVELYSATDEGKTYIHLRISESDGVGDAVIILRKDEATALRDQLSRMIETMP